MRRGARKCAHRGALKTGSSGSALRPAASVIFAGMFIPSLFMLGGLALLAVGAEALVRGSSALALRLGVTPLVVGLTVVAFGTGSPELFVSVEAAYRGESGIALGNVVGSNISNVALILGLSALARPMKVRSELIKREVPLMIGVTLLLCLLLLDGTLSRVEGLVLVAGSVAYSAFAVCRVPLDGLDDLKRRLPAVLFAVNSELHITPHDPSRDVSVIVRVGACGPKRCYRSGGVGVFPYAARAPRCYTSRIPVPE